MSGGGARPRCHQGRSASLVLASLGLAAAALVGCGDPSGATASDPAHDPREVLFSGICDASAAVALTQRLFAVADDEDSVLRIYDADRGGEPVRSVDLSETLFPPDELKQGKRRNEKDKKQHESAEQAAGTAPAEGKPRRVPESDIEAAARVGDVAYWMTSHARNRAGKRKDARLLFFATTARDGNEDLRLLGRGYAKLLEDLLADARYARFDLAAASERAPKDPGGLNLEGLGERPEGGLWIGFRNPVPDGKALLAPLLNPERIVEGERARLGDPILLELGGLGIRSLSRWRGHTLIVAGSHAEGGEAQIFSWDGRASPTAVPGLDLSEFNPEGFFSPEDRDEILLLSDDGAVESDGQECKRLDEPSRKRFRGRWIALPTLLGAASEPAAARAGLRGSIGRVDASAGRGGALRRNWGERSRRGAHSGDFGPQTLQTSRAPEGGMQSKDQILRWVMDTLVNEFQLREEDLHPTAHLIDDLDLDSIDAVDLAVSVEKDLGLSLTEGELKSIQTVQDVVDLIHGRLA
jgi:acyl carrier protein